MSIKSGDFVVRRSYDRDIIFKVKQIFKDENGKLSAILKGVELRLLADAPITDLETVTAPESSKNGQDQRELEQLILKRATIKGDWRGEEEKDGNFFDFPGKVLHLDGDQEYLNKCLAAYDKFKIPNHGLLIPEKEQPKAVPYYLEKYRPGILVITGHDSLLKGATDLNNLDNYRSSAYFAEATKKARQYQPDQDALVIFAGACQSCYEELIRAGANYASSPKRVFIHLFDPVLVIARIAFTSIKDVLTADSITEATVSGSDGIGGIETRGQFRLGFPRGTID